MILTRPVLVAAATAPAVDMAELRDFVRVGVEADADLHEIGASATAHVARTIGRSIVQETWRLWSDGFADRIALGRSDVLSATVSYADGQGALQDVDAASFELLQEPGGDVLRFLPDFVAPDLSDSLSYPVRIDLVTGYGASAANVPADVRHVIKALAAQWYDQRHAETEGARRSLSPSIERALRNLRSASPVGL